MLTIGYHGCSRDLALKVINREAALIPNNQPYHWLGDGIYFWENDPHRALEWAREKEQRNEIEDPFVIGAIIDMGRCLDLHVRENQNLLKDAHGSLSIIFAQAGKKMPVNKKAKGDDRPDAVLRFLDCAVINYFAEEMEKRERSFDTVRGLFVEGSEIYPGAKLFHKTHSEIAVRNVDRVIGYFMPDQSSIAKIL
jgi:hypothetical protein